MVNVPVVKIDGEMVILRHFTIDSAISQERCR